MNPGNSTAIVSQTAPTNPDAAYLEYLRASADVEIVAEPEDTPIDECCGHAECTKSNPESCANWIRSELSMGNPWAWCCVIVTVTALGITESTVLGCCSYVNRREFLGSDYHDDLVTECLERIADARREAA